MFSYHILVQLDNGHLMLLQDNFYLLSLYPQDLQIFAILIGLQILWDKLLFQIDETSYDLV